MNQREKEIESEQKYNIKVSDLIDYNYQPVDLRNDETITKKVVAVLYLWECKKVIRECIINFMRLIGLEMIFPISIRAKINKFVT